VTHLRERHGVQLAKGHGPLASTVFRIGHIGYYDVFDVVTALAAVELGLAELGAQVEPGVGVAHALAAFHGAEVAGSGASADFARRSDG